MSEKMIRNFSIIAHIDHGKSTLADGLISYTGGLSDREMKEQVLDSMDLERERGITIKAQTVRLNYKSKEGKNYIFNLIDTPGHVDFAYEVSRSLAACEGALLVVDASQGVEAQTLANVYLAIDNNLEIIPVLNKIDLPAADPEGVKKQIEDTVGLDCSEAISASAKERIGIQEILESVIKKIPPPKNKDNDLLRALVFDSWFDSYQGVVVLIRIVDGKVSVGDHIKFMSTDAKYEVLKMGYFTPHSTPCQSLSSGEVGFLICGIKSIRDVTVGDTITHLKTPASEILPGFQKIKPMVFAGIFPVESSEFKNVQVALEKLALNDSSLSFEAETSAALGFGYRCGFLGLLHMEIVQERLEREFQLNLITTAPTVVYKVHLNSGEVIVLENPSALPDPTKVLKTEEPILKIVIHTPNEYLGSIIKLCEEKRGRQLGIEYVNEQKVMLQYTLPMSEMVLDFYDRLKTLSKGYASMEYEMRGYEEADLVKLDILINGDSVDALAVITHRQNAQNKGRKLCAKLKELIPKQQFQIAIQAAIGSKIVARETISALRKDVTAKCYGGDISRKRKLLEKQKEGKKRMKQVGAVDVPQDAFLAVLKSED